MYTKFQVGWDSTSSKTTLTKNFDLKWDRQTDKEKRTNRQTNRQTNRPENIEPINGA